MRSNAARSATVVSDADRTAQRSHISSTDETAKRMGSVATNPISVRLRAGEDEEMPLALSVLDQSPISQGMTPGDALGNTIDLARLADRLGFARYWVAEHHGTSMLAGTSPEILIGPIAAATSRLRVGSGGVMLPHYSPLKVAETFKLLSALHPGRIDLAVGRAAGTDPMTAFALQRDRRNAAPDDFPEQ